MNTKWKVWKRYLLAHLNPMREEAETATYQEIKEGVIFKGFNLWILGFAMVVACIGLTTNSISAVIGAMLISPLMGPIIGLAYAVAIGDKPLQNKSLKNWLMMTAMSLLSATLFFLINPFDDSTEVLESFKKASLFDILIAFFGGMAGFVGIVKKEGSKILAGVAIATSCMPPLCTAAYGIAHLDFSFFIGGFYFYLINSMFIGWATFLLARYFKFKPISPIKRSTLYIVLWDIMLVLMMIPGIYIAYQKWKSQKYSHPELTDKQKIELLEKRIEKLEKLGRSR